MTNGLGFDLQGTLWIIETIFTLSDLFLIRGGVFRIRPFGCRAEKGGARKSAGFG